MDQYCARVNDLNTTIVKVKLKVWSNVPLSGANLNTTIVKVKQTL